MSIIRSACIGLLASLAAMTMAAAPVSAQQPKPNILVIMGDGAFLRHQPPHRPCPQRSFPSPRRYDWDVSNPPVLIQTMGGKQLMSVAPKDGQLYGFDLANNSLLYRVPVTQVEDAAQARWGARNGTARPTIRRRTLSSWAKSTGATR
jgi:hypothetical protein